MASDSWKLQKKGLYLPPLQETAEYLEEALSKHFEEASVRVTSCPDLRCEPFGLASEGLAGNPFILQVGGVRNLLPTTNKNKIYDLREVSQVCMPKPGPCHKLTLFGAGAGPYRLLGRNSECIINFNTGSTDQVLAKDALSCHNYVAQLLPDGSYDCAKCSEPQIAFLGDFFASHGLSGCVMHFKLKRRTSEKADVVSLIRQLLIEKYGAERSIGLGGVFLLKRGKAKVHIMQSEIPDGPIDLAKFLVMFELPAPLVGLGMILTNDCGMQLRDVHVHMFDAAGHAGGHYHADVTPEEVEYEAYLSFANNAVHLDTSN